MNYNFIALIIVIVLLIILLYKKYDYAKNVIRVNRLKNRISPNSKILDLGCGNCCLSKKLGNHYDITSVDVVDKSKCDKPIIYDGYTLPFDDNSFDIVIASFVLHHIKHKDFILKEMERVARNKIIIVEDTPTNYVQRKLTQLHSKSDWGDGGMFKDKSEWQQYLSSVIQKSYNLSIEDISAWEMPFADYPFFYPVSATLFEINFI